MKFVSKRNNYNVLKIHGGKNSKDNPSYKILVFPNNMILYPRVNKLILVGMVGAMITNNKATQEYYLVEWMSGPYTVQENTVMKGVEPPHTTFAR